jgi:hypothetical protein
MQVRLDEKVAASYSFAQKRDTGTQNRLTLSPEVDYSVFGAREIRDVLKSREHCLRAGFPANHIIIMTLNEIRDHYVVKVGLPTYLSQMLGELAKAPVQCCTLYNQVGRLIELHLTKNHNQPVLRFIVQQFGKDNLPYKVEVRREAASNQVEVRYL